jgi:hypothetical protein
VHILQCTIRKTILRRTNQKYSLNDLVIQKGLTNQEDARADLLDEMLGTESGEEFDPGDILTPVEPTYTIIVDGLYMVDDLSSAVSWFVQPVKQDKHTKDKWAPMIKPPQPTKSYWQDVHAWKIAQQDLKELTDHCVILEREPRIPDHGDYLLGYLDYENDDDNEEIRKTQERYKGQTNESRKKEPREQVEGQWIDKERPVTPEKVKLRNKKTPEVRKEVRKGEEHTTYQRAKSNENHPEPPIMPTIPGQNLKSFYMKRPIKNPLTIRSYDNTPAMTDQEYSRNARPSLRGKVVDATEKVLPCKERTLAGAT